MLINKSQSAAGYTLIELIVVMLISAILFVGCTFTALCLLHTRNRIMVTESPYKTESLIFEAILRKKLQYGENLKITEGGRSIEYYNPQASERIVLFFDQDPVKSAWQLFEKGSEGVEPLYKFPSNPDNSSFRFELMKSKSSDRLLLTLSHLEPPLVIMLRNSME